MTGRENTGNEKIAALARFLAESRETVIFTGAGISTESGLSDFRSPGGIWDRFDPDELSYPRFISSQESRRNYWKFYREYWKEALGVEPNRAHLAVAKLEKLVNLSAVVTQNIDGLHQKAGNSPEKVFELHGNMWEVRCLSCNDLYPWEDILKLLEEGKEVHNCRLCGGLLKPTTVSFGQSLPEGALREAQRLSGRCDLLLCIGSSLVVYPAAYLPEQAKRGGAKLVILNREPTPLDRIADLVIHGEAGDVLSRVVEAVETKSY
ncbi:MAG: NAD-dependent deacylase [Firmicutes bacterium]|nr:NAD-dependent deacylase [Bacillota bacterium]